MTVPFVDFRCVISNCYACRLVSDDQNERLISMPANDTPTQVQATPTHVQATPSQVQVTPSQVQVTPTNVAAVEASKDVSNYDGTKIIIKRGRGAAKTLDLGKLHMPLQQG